LSLGSSTDCATTECPQACCHTDGTCADQGPRACQASSGQPSGPGTDCASTQCCIELGASGCSADIECCPREGEGVPCNAGRCCLSPAGLPAVAGCSDDTACCAGTCHDFSGDFGGGTGCCFEPGTSGCSATSECCPRDGEGVPCNAGRCCLSPAGLPAVAGCSDDAICCAGTCHDFSGDFGGGTGCCFEPGTSGCSADIECCPREGESVPCNAGRCCLSPASLPAVAGCSDDTACCAGTCHDFSVDFGGGTGCCFEPGTSGCSATSECCPREGETVPCNAGRCCLPPSGPLGIVPCPNDAACCAGTCHVFNDVGGRCCFELGTSGCSADTQCCNSLNGATCNAGTCCISTGTTGCTDSAQCCNHNAICGGGNTCCIPQFRSGCTQDADCCSGLVCTNGTCEGLIEP
jgi:hypothetical protein